VEGGGYLAQQHPADDDHNSMTMSSDVESSILSALSSGPDAAIADSFAFAASSNLDHNSIVGSCKSLQADAYVALTELSTQFYVLSAEAMSIVEHGSQEIRVLNALLATGDDEGLTLSELEAALGKDVVKIGMGNSLKNKWATKDKASGKLKATVADGVIIQDDVKTQLTTLKSAPENENANILDEQALSSLKRRKLISLVTRKSYTIARGPNYAPQRVKKAADLTKEMIESGNWKDTSFKEYNFTTLGESVGGGYLHPLLKVRAEFRKILMEMGFEEMPTNKWVESSFWNFDSLFQPQSHPARDAHDTFFIKEPASTISIPEEYYERVKTMHEVGGSGSIGYRCVFKREEAMKNLLRTHTTAISSQMLYKLANQPGGFQPARYFSIDRVFRNESMDATHLCEFHQVEGLVADYNLSLGDLIGTIETFFRKIGITQLRFKPAFNPYTEPSMEVFGYHPDLKKWTEIGNSGMFRPEMLAPMGLPKDVRVIACEY
jgi:phenylalanyl-tRNA synthetase alpha chain